jgi:EAL domain-containing protein (putative c-di-GMP-specific phosphodiesterase class I)
MADVALYQAKAAGRNQAKVFEPHSPLPSASQLSKDYELRLAIERGQLQLHYQPIVDLRTGRIEGFEALARWSHPKLGSIGPSTFIPMAEENGSILELGQWVLSQSCQQASSWQRLFGQGISMSLNVSAVQFVRSDMVSEVRDAIEASGVNPASIHIEITETTFLEDEEAALENILGLHQLGVRVSIDDFGMGYSSLNYLRMFPADYLKIDKSFIDEIEDERSAGVIAAAIQIGHVLGMKVIAEGVERADQLAALKEAGCDLAQGYLFYSPMDVKPATRLLIDGPHLNMLERHWGAA